MSNRTGFARILVFERRRRDGRSFESLNGDWRATRTRSERHLKLSFPVRGSSKMAVARKSLFIYVLSMINWFSTLRPRTVFGWPNWATNVLNTGKRDWTRLGGTKREKKKNRKREGKRNASECRGRGIQPVVVVVLTYFTVRRVPRVLEFSDALSTRCLPTVIRHDAMLPQTLSTESCEIVTMADEVLPASLERLEIDRLSSCCSQ